jgi:hypothetical protein
MNLIIFGAGASYGSDTCNIPPLGANLFNALNTWGSLPYEYKVALQNDFEQGIQKISQERSVLLAPLQRSMALFFFNFGIRTNNLYNVIAERIKKTGWNLRGSLVTLNYEKMLPMALNHNNLRPVLLPLNNQMQTNEIEICLPHGICNLFVSGVRATRGVTFTAGVMFDGPPECVDNQYQFQYRVINDVIPPIMSYFEPQKSNCSGGNFIGSMRRRYQELVLHADKIAIIGLKVRSFDIHIWEPLSKTNAELIYYSGKQGIKEFSDWCGRERVGKANKNVEGYFSQCFDSLCTEIGIV